MHAFRASCWGLIAEGCPDCNLSVCGLRFHLELNLRGGGGAHRSSFFYIAVVPWMLRTTRMVQFSHATLFFRQLPRSLVCGTQDSVRLSSACGARGVTLRPIRVQF